MKVAMLTREFPPEVYGGAGVHVEYLAAELSQLLDVGVHCFGQPRESALVAASYQPWSALGAGVGAPALAAMSVNLLMAQGGAGADLVHSHTWYANFGGHLAKLLHGVPHVMTAHSLEPLRPWKQQQLGSGYAISCFCERTAIEAADAVIAVSAAMKADIMSSYPAIEGRRVEVIHNGVDPDEYWPDPATGGLEGYGIDPDRPSVVFVGRITHQKGILPLLEAANWVDAQAQLVLCASAPDTPAIAAEVSAAIDGLRQHRDGVIWIEEMVPRPALVRILSNARVFVCPSRYEPFGLVNVEAMACGAPVVATAVGGIPEIVVDGETGFLVPVAVDAPERLAADLAAPINQLVRDPALARRFGAAGRQRVLEHFSWPAIAAETFNLYRKVLGTV